MVGLITSDWHLNENPRDQHRWDFVGKSLPNILEKREVHWLAILGDLTDEFDNHSAALTNKIVNLLTMLAKDRLVYILRGNHDCIDPITPFFKFVSKLRNINWINTPEAFPKKELGQTLWLPHSRNPVKDWKNVNFTGVDYIFAHQTFKGAIGDSGAALDGVTLADVLPSKIPIISGDIHVPQDIGWVTYVGSPYKTTFTANDYKPRVLLVTEDGNLKSIRLSGPQKQLVFAENADMINKMLTAAKGDIVKLRVRLTPQEALNWQGIKKSIEQDAQRLGVTLHSIEALLDTPTTNKKYKLNNKTQSHEEILRMYAKQQGIEGTRLDTGLAIIEGK